LENFKVGGLEKYGLDYPALSALNPRLVYCSITGFGQDGPYADRAGYDYMIQGMSGLMSITGQPDGEPQRVGVAVTDLFSGLYAVIGILAALRERDRTGRGQHLDIALLDCATAMLANQAMNFFASGRRRAHRQRAPEHRPLPGLPGGRRRRDRGLRQRRPVPPVLRGAEPPCPRRRPRLRHEPRPRDAARDARAPPAEATRAWRRDDLLAALRAVGVPAGPINSIAQVFDDEQVQARGLRIRPEGVDGVRAPFRFSESTLDTARTAPRLDQHGAEIRENGFG
jgi:crotonobetainyl-CoA:carnitine CoA-transferase CaiB-like acyl-CoA transferase